MSPQPPAAPGWARDRGCMRVWLETGSIAAYAPARQMYRGAGFTVCGPFTDYREDPNSAFMVLDLPAGA